jgi:NifU-like protein involved in Fe-S cluster formation
MDQTILQFYRDYLKKNFPHSGELENASIFVEAVNQPMIDCGQTGSYMQLYLQVEDQRITEIKYLCACEPEANVAVELLCELVKGRTLSEARGFTEEPFYQLTGSRDEKFSRKVRGLLALLHEGIASYTPARS